MKAKLAEHMKQYMARPEVKAKRAEQMKQYNRVLSVNICCSLRCLLAQKAKRTEQMKQYNQQYKASTELTDKSTEHVPTDTLVLRG